MNIDFDYFNRYESPMLTLCNPSNSEIGVINGFKDLIIKPRFNNLSELEFNISKCDTNSEIYRLLEERRQILVEGLGYFIISSCSETNESNSCTKKVIAESCEVELANIDLQYLSGTYPFFNVNTDDEGKPIGLINLVVSQLPKWTLREIDGTIASRYRTFDVPLTSVYNFLVKDMANSFGCIFIFDILNRCIDVKDIDNIIHPTSIHLSYQNLLNKVEIETIVGNISTALMVTGGDDLDISQVNILGGNIVYDFGYYLNEEWMESELINKINLWQSLINEKQLVFIDNVEQMQTIQSEIMKLSGEISLLKSDLEGKLKAKDACISANMGSLDNEENVRVNIDIENIRADIAAKESTLSAKNSEYDALILAQKALSDSVALQTYFNETEFETISSYIIQSSYQDSTFTPTDNNEYANQQGFENAFQYNISKASDLYSKSKRVLGELCYPQYSIEIDSNNFIFNKEFQSFTNQISMGCSINVEVRPNDFAELVLLGLDLNYESGTVSMEYSNRYRSFKPKNLFDELLDRTTRTSNTLNFQRSDYLYAKKDNQLDHAVEFSKQPLDLTKNSVLSSDGQIIEMNEHGLHGRAFDDTSESGYSPKELRIVHNTIAFSDDGFKTSKLALGEITFADGSKKYGLVGDYLYGTMIAGKYLTISSPNGDFVIDEKGVHTDLFVTSEYINELLENVIEKNTSLINATSSQIMSSIEQVYMKQSDIEKYSSKIEQTAKDLTIQFNEMSENNNILSELWTRVSITKDGVKVGESGSDVSLVISNDKISFYDDREEVSYFGDKKLHITQCEITQQLDIGKFSFVPRNNGNLSVVWKG